MGHARLFIALTLLIDGLAGLAGALLSERHLRRYQTALVGFAAGALLAAVFLEVLPEALESFGHGALVWVFSSFVALAIIEWFLGHHHQSESEPPRALPATLLIADALHNIGDGAAVAAAFLVSPGAGLAVGLAVVAHEVPQEVGDYALLRASGFPRARALLALGAVQLTAVLGAAGVVMAAGHFQHVTAAALSIAAGTFLYIGATDLLPEVHCGRTSVERRKRMLGFLCGVCIIVLSSALEFDR